ncbi:hypothetical protein ACFL1X_00650 [Candidatus Hydrogenedentota bacterium]
MRDYSILPFILVLVFATNCTTEEQESQEPNVSRETQPTTRTEVPATPAPASGTSEVKGRVTLRGTPPPPETCKIELRVSHVGDKGHKGLWKGCYVAEMEPDGSYRLSGIPGGRVVLRITVKESATGMVHIHAEDIRLGDGEIVTRDVEVS